MKSEDEYLVNKTLESLDGIERAKVKPYFYTRLQGRLQNERIENRNQVRFAWIAVCVMLFINAFVYYNDGQDTVLNETNDPITLMSEEYSLSSDYSFLSVTE